RNDPFADYISIPQADMFLSYGEDSKMFPGRYVPYLYRAYTNAMDVEVGVVTKKTETILLRDGIIESAPSTTPYDISGGNIQANIVTPGKSRYKIEVSNDGGQTFIDATRSEEHTSELQSRENLVCRLLLE